MLSEIIRFDQTWSRFEKNDWDYLGEKRKFQIFRSSSERSKLCLLDLCDVIRRADHATRIDKLRARTQGLPISHAIVVICFVTAASPSRN